MEEAAKPRISVRKRAEEIKAFRCKNLIAVLERIGERRWRLVIPWPQNESNLDLIELVPA